MLVKIKNGVIGFAEIIGQGTIRDIGENREI